MTNELGWEMYKRIWSSDTERKRRVSLENPLLQAQHVSGTLSESQMYEG